MFFDANDGEGWLFGIDCRRLWWWPSHVIMGLYPVGVG